MDASSKRDVATIVGGADEGGNGAWDGPVGSAVERRPRMAASKLIGGELFRSSKASSRSS
jgi:hypothetical protein